MTTLLSDLPCVVLDSNVVLDWLLFGDRSAHALASAIRARRIRWIATVAMRQELEHVLTRLAFDRWPASPKVILSTWDDWALPVAAPASHPPIGLRCSDPDDQKFIDLALHCRAHALLSRDRAVLRLAGKAKRFELKIQSAEAWGRAAAAAPVA